MHHALYQRIFYTWLHLWFFKDNDKINYYELFHCDHQQGFLKIVFLSSSYFSGNQEQYVGKILCDTYNHTAILSYPLFSTNQQSGSCRKSFIHPDPYPSTSHAWIFPHIILSPHPWFPYLFSSSCLKTFL